MKKSAVLATLTALFCVMAIPAYAEQTNPGETRFELSLKGQKEGDVNPDTGAVLSRDDLHPSIKENTSADKIRLGRLLEQARQREEDQQDADKPQTRSTARSSDIGINYCRQLGSPSGSMPNRHNFCYNDTATVKAMRCRPICVPVSKAEFQVTVWGRGTNGAREIDVSTMLSDFKITGDEVKDEKLEIRMSCEREHSEAPQCPNRTRARSKTIGNWKDPLERVWTETFTSAEGGITDEVLSYYKLKTEVVFPQGQSALITTDFRCDSSAKAAKGKGCIFQGRVPTWTIPIMKPDGTTPSPVQELAQHVLDALYRPEQTVPYQEDKDLPGSQGSGRPLHRLYSGTPEYNDNRAATSRICKQEWTADERRGKDCDEYPMASTREGLRSGEGSVRPINPSHNRVGGTNLKNWYEHYRIVQDDPFYVVVLYGGELEKFS
ncbi:NucA/NucB deoxyribonuclease domain-containing protein [Nocardiopsis rhodophaea]|uniref:NucA/NucB deoxyribonuclease domain-containing protein n=1 Tax=Nocardiopsis rhodophaea TaxID=280238 RepID=UPI0031D97087